MIKVAFVINSILSPSAGTEKQLLLLLKTLDRSRFSPVLCVVHGSEWLRNEFDLCPLHILGIESYKHPAFLYRFWQFVRYLKVEKFDIIHTLFEDGMRIGITAGKLAGINKIISVRRSQGYWMTTFDLMVTKILNRWVDLIIANSHNTREWTSEVEGFPTEKIKVVHNGIDLEPFRNIPAGTNVSYRARLNIPIDALVVCIVANLRPVKSIDVFIRAAGIVKAEIANAHFIIVGDGELEEKLKQKSRDLGLDLCIHFLGRRFDIPQILSMSNIGVLSSRSESFSNTIVEYLAAGLPVVCTDVGGAREAVHDCINGFVILSGDYLNMADKIITIWRDGKAQVMGEASLRKAESSFTLQTMMKQYEEIYAGSEIKR